VPDEGAASAGGLTTEDQAGHDLALIVAVSVGAIALSIQFDLAETTLRWMLGANELNLNGLLTLGVVAPVAAALFSYRRHREVAEARSELARLSVQDTLTGLPNRRALPGYLADGVREGGASPCCSSTWTGSRS